MMTPEEQKAYDEAMQAADDITLGKAKSDRQLGLSQETIRRLTMERDSAQFEIAQLAGDEKIKSFKMTVEKLRATEKERDELKTIIEKIGNCIPYREFGDWSNEP